MIIAAAGDKAFCSGMYVTEAARKTAETGETGGYTIFKPWTDMMQSIEKPFICAVNGYCIGGGWHLVADSDIVIASENAQFFDTHVNIGLINGVESAGLAYKMPLGIVMRMSLEGKHFRINAQQATGIGGAAAGKIDRQGLGDCHPYRRRCGAVGSPGHQARDHGCDRSRPGGRHSLDLDCVDRYSEYAGHEGGLPVLRRKKKAEVRRALRARMIR